MCAPTAPPSGWRGSIHKLTPLCDFVAKINNNGTEPELTAYSVVDSSKNWGLIAGQFAKPPFAHFPQSMAPMVLVELGPLSDVAKPVTRASGEQAAFNGAAQLQLSNSHPALAAVAPGLAGGVRGTTTLACSPSHLVTLPKSAREGAGVPCNADTFVFAYPSNRLDPEAVAGFTYAEEDRACLLPLLGGFVYFDTAGTVCGVNAILGQSHDLLESDRSETLKRTRLLQFGMPEVLPTAAARALMTPGARRMQPVTLEALANRGACEFAWVCPGEKLDGMKGGTPMGSFAYLMKEGCDNYFFPVSS